MNMVLPPTRPPSPPEPLAKRSCGYIARDAKGQYWFWHFVWGHHDGEPPVYVGGSRPEVSRNLQGLQFSVPIYMEDAQ